MRDIDGAKLVKGMKLFAICDKRGRLLDLELQPANTDDRAGILPMLPHLPRLASKVAFSATAASQPVDEIGLG